MNLMTSIGVIITAVVVCNYGSIFFTLLEQINKNLGEIHEMLRRNDRANVAEKFTAICEKESKIETDRIYLKEMTRRKAEQDKIPN